MPASDISRISTVGHPKSDMAATLAKEMAYKEIRYRIEKGLLLRHDEQSIRREWKDIYKQEYYKYYAMLVQQDQRPEKIVYVALANPAATKFVGKHCVAGFNKTNFLIHVRAGSITMGRINYPLDEDLSLETKEALLGAWPGPLDRYDENLKRKTTDYIDTLYSQDRQRKIRYSNNDEQRRVILRLLTELLHRNGSIDAPGVTRLLLEPAQTEIQKDEGNRRPLDTLQTYLLLGKRSEAIKYARSRRLWDHAQCLAFLDKYQPQGSFNYHRDGLRLKDDSIVQLNDEYINSIEPGILNTVYRSLLNRVLRSDPESLTIVKHAKVGNNIYEFAMLSANDCDMEFDQSNEIFKLVQAVKRANEPSCLTNSHMIALGMAAIDNSDTSDDLSYLSNLSFRQIETHALRTLIISNIDMLILNEIWEYCYNLAHRYNDSKDYEYIINLIPYKLIFASKLLDYGLYGMFGYYLDSIKNSLMKAKSAKYDLDKDQYYDWDTIDCSVESISQVWDLIRASSNPQYQQEATSFEFKQRTSSTGANFVIGGGSMHQTPAQAQNMSATMYNTAPVASQQQNLYHHHAHQTHSSFQPQQQQQQHRFPHSQEANMPQHNQMIYQQQQQQYAPTRSMQLSETGVQNLAQPRIDHIDSAGSSQDYRSLPYMGDASGNSMAYPAAPAFRAPIHNIPPGFANQQPVIPEETNDFNPDPEPASESQDPEYGQQQSSTSLNDYSDEQSRRTSMDVPPFVPNAHGQTSVPPLPPPPAHLADRSSTGGAKQMSSSSPVNRSRGPVEPHMADSFNAFSPINDYDDLPQRDTSNSDMQAQNLRGPPHQFGALPRSPPDFGAPTNSAAPSGRTAPDASNTASHNKQQQSGPATSANVGDGPAQTSSIGGDPQKAGFIANLAGSVRGLLPKSNSKQMILPDDSSKTIVYDNERKTWIDTTKGEDEQQEDYNEPPPMMPPTRQPPNSYSLGSKSTKNRYPRA